MLVFKYIQICKQMSKGFFVVLLVVVCLFVFLWHEVNFLNIMQFSQVVIIYEYFYGKVNLRISQNLWN